MFQNRSTVQSPNDCNSRRGFTLLELIMVIAILGIISTLAVSKIGNLRDTSARKVSVVNQQAVSRAVEVFLAGTGRGRLNRLDSLMPCNSSTRAASAGIGFQYGHTNAASRLTWMYNGENPSNEYASETNAGLTPGLQDVLVPYGLAKKEALCFVDRLGLKFVMLHLNAEDGLADNDHGEDEVIMRDLAAKRADPESSAAFAHSLTNASGGCTLLAVTPTTTAGRAIYRDCGQELLDTSETGIYDETEALQQAKATGGILFAFGLGENCSIIGKGEGGLEGVPHAEYPLRKFYRNYILLFRLNPDAAGHPTPEFAGVLDPCGNTIRGARSAIDR